MDWAVLGDGRSSLVAVSNDVEGDDEGDGAGGSGGESAESV